jgi:hypothetical protein
MSLSHTPTIEPFPLRAVDELQPSVDRYSPLPLATDIKAHKLFGIPLKSSLTGETLPDSTIDFYINAAISELEHILDISITPVVYYDKYDYIRERFTWSYNYLKVDHSPILNVEKVELSFSNDMDVNGFVQFPLEHVHVMPQEGVIQLVPAFGTSLSGFLMSAFSGTQFHALRATGMTDFPGGLRVKYTAGFNQDKIPYEIVQTIETMAAIQILSLMGPVFQPNNSVSIGIDGVSQSTSTPGVRFFMERLDMLTKERDRQIDLLKGYYQKRWLIDCF